jgi:hypothetical protein
MRHLESDSGFSWGAPIELPTSAFNYGPDPNVVTTGYAWQVAYVVIGHSDGNGHVAIAFSADGGVHFGNVHLVSTPEFGSDVDQPVAALSWLKRRFGCNGRRWAPVADL